MPFVQYLLTFSNQPNEQLNIYLFELYANEALFRLNARYKNNNGKIQCYENFSNETDG